MEIRGSLAALGASGFAPPSVDDQRFWKAAYYNLPVPVAGDKAGAVELHWMLAQPDRHRTDLDGLFARSRTVDAAGGHYRILGPVDLLLHQVLHHGYHFFLPKLIWLHDLALLLADPPALDQVIARASPSGVRVASQRWPRRCSSWPGPSADPVRRSGPGK